MRFTPFFPAHRCVEVSGFEIDRLTNTSKGDFKPSKSKGEVRPFLAPLRQAAGEVFAVYSIIRKVSKKIQEIGKSKE